MAALTLTGHALHNAEIEYHGKFGHTLGRIQHIALMSRIDLCYATCHLETQTVSPTLPGFQGIKRCVQYLASHPHKPIFILLILMKYQISAGLHGVEIKLKTTQQKIDQNVIRMQTMPELSTEDGQFQVLSTLYLVLMSAGNYRFNQL